MDWEARPEKEAELERLWEGGKTAGNIAKIMGLTKNQIVGKAHRMHLTPRPSPIKKKKRVKASVRNDIAVALVADTPKRKALTPKALPSTGIFQKCQFPFGDDPATMKFCGKRTCFAPDGRRSSYCQPHHDKCHTRKVA